VLPPPLLLLFPELALPVLPLVLSVLLFEPLLVLLELLVLSEVVLLFGLLDVLPLRSPDCRFVVVVFVSVVPGLPAVPELVVVADEPARSAAELPTPGVGLFITSPVEPGSLGRSELLVPLVALPGPPVALPGPPVALPGPPVALPGPGVSVACPLPPELFGAPVALLEFV
jgi:hypothetical protein